MQMDQKYIIYHFLDQVDENDDLHLVQIVSKMFGLNLERVEQYVRRWLNEPEYSFLFRLMQKLAGLYNKVLSKYKDTPAFWEDTITHLDPNIIEILLVLLEEKPVDQVKDLLKRRIAS
jgi:hypothetical protein